jgi:hypothetical protein
LLLDRVEVFFSDVVEVLTELFDEDRVTLFIFRENQLLDIEDLKLQEEGIDKTVYDYLREKQNITKLNRLPHLRQAGCPNAECQSHFLTKR